MSAQLFLGRGLLAAIAFSLSAATLSLAAAAPSIDASIEPSQIEVGESARLTILTSGSGTLSVPLPVVPGLEFRVVGQTRQVQLINGAAIESTSTIIRVTPEEAGVFTIPGVTPKSPPLVLRVNPGRGGGSSPPSGNGASPGATTLVPVKGSANGVRLTPDGSAFVRLEIPKHEIYVGESIPIEIQVGMRDGFVASVNGLPKLNSGDFTLNNLSHQPDRAAKVVDGKPFTVFTWRSVLAAIKPGTFSLSFETPLTVRMRTRPVRDSMLDDLLGDPFLQNVFGATVPKNINVASPETPFTVLQLPAQGKPSDFGGAVGNFKISADISAPTNTAGDPLTLRLRVNGTGNFDRVESSMLGADAQWKTYEPKAAFNAADGTGHRGEKIFEQPLIALQPGAHTIPPLSFSFFNPATRHYETARSAPLNVTVALSAADIAASVPAAGAGTPAGATENMKASVDNGLRPDHAETTARVDSLVPPYFQRPFLGVTSALALLIGGGWITLHRRERKASDMQRKRERERSRMAHALLEEMSAASARGDAAAFFTAARSAYQISICDTEVQIEGADADDIGQILALADESNYSAGLAQAADFGHWTELVRRRLPLEDPR